MIEMTIKIDISILLKKQKYKERCVALKKAVWIYYDPYKISSF